MMIMISYIVQWVIYYITIHVLINGYFTITVGLELNDPRSTRDGVFSAFKEIYMYFIGWPKKVFKTKYFKSPSSVLIFKIMWCIKRYCLIISLLVTFIINLFFKIEFV